MGKYILALLNSVKNSFAYRANSFIMMLSVFFSFGVMYFLWASIYRQGNQIGNYSFNEIITYYIYVTIFELLFVNYVAWDIGEEIKNGHLTNVILKPIKYLEYKFAQNLGTLLYRTILFIPMIALSIFLLRSFMIFPDNQIVYAYFFILAILSYVLNFLIYYIIGIFAFWMDDVYGFLFVSLVMISFLQGQWIPLDLLPTWFSTLNNFLPFKYLFYVPVGIVSERIAFDFSIIFITLGWIGMLYLIAYLIYKRGLKKYEGYGL